MAGLVEELIGLLEPEALILGSALELMGLRRIVAEGTSASRHRRVYSESMRQGAGSEAALRSVVDALAEDFLNNVA